MSYSETGEVETSGGESSPTTLSPSALAMSSRSLVEGRRSPLMI